MIKVGLTHLAQFLGFTYDKASTHPSDDDFEEEENPFLGALKDALEEIFSDQFFEIHPELQNEAQKNQRYISLKTVCNLALIQKFHPRDEQMVLNCAAGSDFLEVDHQSKMIRSREPFKKDLRRLYRTIRVSGFEKEAGKYNQISFFNSIFPGSVVRVSLQRKYDQENNKLIYDGVTFVELNNEETAKEAAERQIYYTDNENLEVKIAADCVQKNNPPPKLKKRYNIKASNSESDHQ